MAEGFTIKHRDEFEEMEGSGNCTWRLLRRGMGVPVFGINMVEIGPGGQIPEHDESGSGQHEVFGILDGEGAFRLNGEDHPAGPGSFVHMEPQVRRTIVNHSDAPLTALLIGVPGDSGYKPKSDWL
jgi:quercetin dioxygenase-like cupin family protein